jgi:surfactin synthase thioesterase subunit
VKTTLKLSLFVVGGIAAMFFVCGCQEPSKPKSEECRKAYEQNQQLYDYSGGMPEACRDQNTQSH